MKVTERSVQEIGKSLLITLPKEWADALHVTKGAKLKLITSERGALSIVPEFVERHERKEAMIPLDEHFDRRFFREYFEGNERIVITLGSAPSARRTQMYQFLKRFMNLQVIEETESRVTVKCFRIDDLSMQECLSRMHYLSLNLIDEVLSGGDSRKLQEIRDTMTRFYYMLVMQVRRYLSEGKFTDQTQVTLIKAMDIRMAAEKIQRIGQEAVTLRQPVRQRERLATIAGYYRKAFSCFANDDFQKALPLWTEGNRLQRADQHAKAAGAELAALQRILRYAKEISMLVR